MKVPLLNFVGGPGVPLLNFEGGPGVPLLNFMGSHIPLLNFEGVPGSRRPTPRGPGLTFTPCPFLFTYYFVTKKSLNNIPYRKTFQNKKRTCFNKIYFNLLYCKDMVKSYYIKGVQSVKKSSVCKVLVLESFKKFTEKHLCWSNFLTKLQARTISITIVFL